MKARFFSAVLAAMMLATASVGITASAEEAPADDAPAVENKWAAEYKELAELLTPQEYAQARSTVNDAFYTSPTVIERQNGYKSVFK